jgi:hypothetical protein
MSEVIDLAKNVAWESMMISDVLPALQFALFLSKPYVVQAAPSVVCAAKLVRPAA